MLKTSTVQVTNLFPIIFNLATSGVTNPEGQRNQVCPMLLSPACNSDTLFPGVQLKFLVTRLVVSLIHMIFWLHLLSSSSCLTKVRGSANTNLTGGRVYWCWTSSPDTNAFVQLGQTSSSRAFNPRGMVFFVRHLGW